MQAHFCAGDGTSLYREAPHGKGATTYAALWPFTRALAATLDLEGVTPELLPGFRSRQAVSSRFEGLDRYRGDPRAYDSAVVPPHGRGGDKYYDDNAWVGLAFVQHQRLTKAASSRGRAEELFAFALTGWDSDPSHPSPGGIFWVKQGVGRGLTDHTRHTISNGPNAQLGFHLHEITGSSAFDGASRQVGARSMYDWVNGALEEVGAGNRSEGLYFDSLRLDGSIDKTLWTYNQGVMIGANVLRHRLTGDASYTARAEAIARKTMAHFGRNWFAQPEQFNAILFRNLLLLHHATADAALRQRIVDVISAYADEAWQTRRDSDGLFPKGAPSLVKHAAMVQIFATLAWAPSRYTKLA